MQKKLTAYFNSQYREYRDAVLCGKRNAGQLEIAMVKRQEQDLVSLKGWTFDMDRACAPLIWFAANLKFPSGEKNGQPLKLEPWQVWLVMVLFGWIDDGGNRRYHNAYIEIARKNGKSALAAAILCYLAFSMTEQNGTPCYIGATDLDQAGEVFERAAGCLSAMPVTVHNSKNNKQILWEGARITAISAKPKDGKLAHGAVIDEYHEHRSNDLINSIVYGNVSDRNAMVIRTTTAGTNLHGVCKEEHDKGARILNGEEKADSWFFAIYTMDRTDSADDVQAWEKANPNLGVSVEPSLLKGLYESARLSASDMMAFKTKNLNIWCNSLARWANMDVWNAKCTAQNESWHKFVFEPAGRLCFGGLDLSSNSDFTAFTLDFPVGEGKHLQLTHCWIADAMKYTIARQCRIPLDRWIAQGWVTATPGDAIDYDYVRDYLTEAYTQYNLQYIACDRWKIEELVRLMPPWFSDVAYEFSQGMKTMTPSIQAFERAYLEGQVYAADNEVVTWMMSCAEVFQDSNGNVKLVKPKRRTESRIDAVITSVMALDCAVKHEEETVSDVGSLFSFF